jgi:hypothetical protein
MVANAEPERAAGSIDGLGGRSQPFRITRLDLTGASWNRLTRWLRKVEALTSAA